MHKESRKAVLAALFANFFIAIFKIVAAIFSRSSSMMAEGYHSISDTLNQVLLLYGLRRCRRAPTQLHPFGYGKEQFFWSFMVAIMLFGVAGVLSIREGYHKLLHPEPISHLGLNYLALGFAFVFETYAIRIAIRNIRKEMKQEKYLTFWKAMRNSKDPTTLTVLIEDSLALIGLLIAAVAITLVRLTGILIIDGIASMLIGAFLMVFAVFLAFETKKLLVGEAVSKVKREKLLEAVRSFPEVQKLISLKTMHLSSEEVLVALEVNYRDDLKADDIELLNDRIEEKIKGIIPEAKIYIEAEN